MQWNCMYSEDVHAVTQLIKELNPDIVCLQEITKDYDSRWNDVGAYIADSLGYFAHYEYGHMILPDGKSAMMGNGIFSRYPITGKEAIQVSFRDVESGGSIQDDRYYLQVLINVPGNLSKDVTVGTVHLPFHPRFVTTPMATKIVDTVLENIPEQGDVILMGDLNRTPGTQAARRLRQAGLRNVGPAFNKPTWTTKPFNIGPWQYDALKWRLDYTLYRGEGVRRSAQVVPTKLSDHLPILVELDL